MESALEKSALFCGLKSGRSRFDHGTFRQGIYENRPFAPHRQNPPGKEVEPI